MEISDLIAKMAAVGMVTTDNIVGCTDEQIAQIEATFAVKLPDSYKQFLTKMGVAAGYFLHGSKLYFPETLTLKQPAEKLLTAADVSFRLSKEDFVFLVHQDYQFMFFDTAAGDDPPVHRFCEGQLGLEEVDKHFSDWLQSCVIDECKLFEDNREVRAELGLSL